MQDKSSLPKLGIADFLSNKFFRSNDQWNLLVIESSLDSSSKLIAESVNATQDEIFRLDKAFQLCDEDTDKSIELIDEMPILDSWIPIVQVTNVDWVVVYCSFYTDNSIDAEAISSLLQTRCLEISRHDISTTLSMRLFNCGEQLEYMEFSLIGERDYVFKSVITDAPNLNFSQEGEYSSDENDIPDNLKKVIDFLDQYCVEKNICVPCCFPTFQIDSPDMLQEMEDERDCLTLGVFANSLELISYTNFVRNNSEIS
jgi:hypothetical protein